MTWLYIAGSIAFASVINLIFKAFDRYSVDKFAAITINYLVCVLVALAIDGNSTVFFDKFWVRDWFPIAVGLGLLFILIFYLIGLTNQISGVSVAAAASKLGVIIPVMTGVLFFGEPISFPVGAAIIASLVSVVLISHKPREPHHGKYLWILLPLAVMVGSGIIDTTLKYIQSYALGNSPESHPTTMIFAGAGISGMVIMLLQPAKRSKLKYGKNWIAGILLGIPNYFSIWLLLKALNTGELTSVVIFPLNNISIVVVSTLASLMIFREKLSYRNIAGLIIALISIFIISRYQ